MAAQKIGYPNKQSGSLWTSSNANEVKDVVNSHADNIDNANERINLLGQSVSQQTENINALSEKAQIPIVQHASSEQRASIVPNKLNVWGGMSSLTIALLSGDSGVTNEYMIQFTVSSSSFSLSFINSVIWMDEPDWEVGYTYQVSVLNGLAIAAGWEGGQYNINLISESVYIRTKSNVAPIIWDSDDPTGGGDSAGKYSTDNGYLPMVHVTSGEVERNGLDERVGDIGFYDGDSSYGECTATAKGTNATWPYEWLIIRTKNPSSPWTDYVGGMTPYNN